MSKKDFIVYDAPQVEIIEVEVESGFVGSTGAGQDPEDEIG